MSKRECLIAELYRSHYEDLLRLARVLLHNEEDARDAVSDVMTRLIDKQQASEGLCLLTTRRSALMTKMKSVIRTISCLSRPN